MSNGACPRWVQKISVRKLFFDGYLTYGHPKIHIECVSGVEFLEGWVNHLIQGKQVAF